MLTDERKNHLLKKLQRSGRLVAKDESRNLGLSEDTIRRDLREMAAGGKLKRVHGGAVPISQDALTYPQRLPVASPEKIRIGERAAGLIEPGQVVFIDGGTTARQMARHLPLDLSATIITHSPSIAMELLAHENLTVELIGGRLFRHSVIAMGAEAMHQLDRTLPDACFIGVTGAHPEHGLTTGDSEEAQMKHRIIERSGESTILLSPEKICAVSPYRVAEWPLIDRIVTHDLPNDFRQGLAAHQCEILDVG
ncbi:MAG: DeoR/GlpR family DNA-binding transcription regulator [Stappiaceae bacterium]